MLAKLTRPRLHDALLRQRLFDLLDHARERHRAICVIGPPGSGKTTLVATWLDERVLPGIWMQIDAGDADLASFFYYLGQAATGLDGYTGRHLPVLTPEYLGDVPGFSRRFFRELFSLLPPCAALVLDNYQDVAEDNPFHALIAQAVEEVPAGANLILVSRSEPPQSYARTIANENVAVIGWEQLKLTAEEAREISAQRSRVASPQLEKMFQESGGWVAGLTLLLASATGSLESSAPDPSEPPERLFDYFATQVFCEAMPAHRKILCQLSLMPHVTARLADTLTGDTDAKRLLEHLYRRHLFTDRRGGEDGAYTFHALFRAFLRHSANAVLSTEEVANIQRQGARLLEAEKLSEDAMELYVASGEYESAARLFALAAPELLAAGRWKTVMDWFQLLTPEAAAADPWVRYWYGAAQIAIAPAQARDQLALAHFRAAELGEVMCQIQSAAGIIESCCVEWSRFSLMDRWIPVLEQAIDETLPWPSNDARLRAMNALLSALAYRAPEHRLLPLCVEKTLALLPSAADPNIKVVAASTLTNHGGHSAQPRVSRAGLALLEQWIDDPAVTMPNRAAGLFAVIWCHHQLRNVEAARTAVAELERLAQETGLLYAGTFSAFMGANVEGCQGDMVEARQWFERLSNRTDPSRWYDRAIYCCTAVWMSMYERDPQLALMHGEEGIELITDGVINSAIQWRYPVAVAHARRGDRHAMQRLLDEILVFVEKHRLNYWTALCRAAHAILALRLGDRDGLLGALSDLLRISRCTEETHLWYLRNDLPELFDVALSENIESEEVARFIRLYNLPAPSPLSRHWPWSVVVRVLGGLSLEIDGAPIEFKGKTPRKPLAILKALICLGGREVSVVRLADLIWPDMDGDEALRAFHTALYRLRALLKHEHVLRLKDGRLSIDRTRVWVDALVFEDLCIAARSGDNTAARRAVELYRDALLDDEPDVTWAITARQRLDHEHRLVVARTERLDALRDPNP